MVEMTRAERIKQNKKEWNDLMDALLLCPTSSHHLTPEEAVCIHDLNDCNREYFALLEEKN